MRVGHSSGHVVIVLTHIEAERVERAVDAAAKLGASLKSRELQPLAQLLKVWREKEQIPQ